VFVKPPDAIQDTDGKTHVGRKQHVTVDQRRFVRGGLVGRFHGENDTAPDRFDASRDDDVVDVCQAGRQPRYPITSNVTIVVSHRGVTCAYLF